MFFSGVFNDKFVDKQQGNHWQNYHFYNASMDVEFPPSIFHQARPNAVLYDASGGGEEPRGAHIGA